MTVRDFTEQFVAHNSVVYIYTNTHKIEDGVRFTEWKLLWKGMDWQISYSPYDEDYFKIHPEVKKCPFNNRKVLVVTNPLACDKPLAEEFYSIGLVVSEEKCDEF